MPLSDRQRMMGLNTDLPPDRLGDAAFRTENMTPVSSETARPRKGVSLVNHYQPGSVGRNVIVDGLEGAEGEGVLVVVVNTADAGSGTVDEEVHGVYEFRPPMVADEYADNEGMASATLIYGIVF